MFKVSMCRVQIEWILVKVCVDDETARSSGFVNILRKAKRGTKGSLLPEFRIAKTSFENWLKHSVRLRITLEKNRAGRRSPVQAT
jgi:hypothetical protein